MAITHVKGIKKSLKIMFFAFIATIILFLQNPLVARAQIMYDSIGEDKSGLKVTSFSTEPFLIDKYDSLEVSCSLNTSVNSGGGYWPCSASCTLIPQGESNGITILNVSAESVGSGTKSNSISVKDLKGYYYLYWTTNCFRASNGDWCSSVNVYKTKASYKNKSFMITDETTIPWIGSTSSSNSGAGDYRVSISPSTSDYDLSRVDLLSFTMSASASAGSSSAGPSAGASYTITDLNSNTVLQSQSIGNTSQVVKFNVKSFREQGYDVTSVKISVSASASVSCAHVSSCQGRVSVSVSAIKLELAPKTPSFYNSILTSVNVFEGDNVSLFNPGTFPSGENCYVWQKFNATTSNVDGNGYPDYTIGTGKHVVATPGIDPGSMYEYTDINYDANNNGYNYAANWNRDGNWNLLFDGFDYPQQASNSKYRINNGALTFKATKEDDGTFYRVILVDTAGNGDCVDSRIVKINVFDASFEELQTVCTLGEEVNIGRKITNDQILSMLFFSGNTQPKVKVALQGVVFTADNEVFYSPESLVENQSRLTFIVYDENSPDYSKRILGVVKGFESDSFTVETASGDEVIRRADIIGSYYSNRDGETEVTVAEGVNNFTNAYYILGKQQGYSTSKTANVFAVGDRVLFVYNDDAGNEQYILGTLSDIEGTETDITNYVFSNGTKVNPSNIICASYSRTCDLTLTGTDKEAPKVFAIREENDGLSDADIYSRLVPNNGSLEASVSVPVRIEGTNSYLVDYATNKKTVDYELKICAKDNISADNDITFKWYGPFSTKQAGLDLIAADSAGGKLLGSTSKLTLNGNIADPKTNNGFYICEIKDTSGNATLATFHIRVWDMEKPKFKQVLLDPSNEVISSSKTLSVLATDNYAMANKAYAFTMVKEVPAENDPSWSFSPSKQINEEGTYYFCARDVFGNIACSWNEADWEDGAWDKAKEELGIEDDDDEPKIPITNVDSLPPVITSLQVSSYLNDNSEAAYKVKITAKDNVSDNLTFEILNNAEELIIDSTTGLPLSIVSSGGKSSSGAFAEFKNLDGNDFYVVVKDEGGLKSIQHTGFNSGTGGEGDEVLRMLGITFEISPLSFTNGDVTLKLKVADTSKLAASNCFCLYKGDSLLYDWSGFTEGSSEKIFTIRDNAKYYVYIKDSDGDVHKSNDITIDNIDRHNPYISATQQGTKLIINLHDKVADGDNNAESGLNRLTLSVNGSADRILQVYGDNVGRTNSTNPEVTYSYDIEEKGDYVITAYDIAGNSSIVNEEGNGKLHIDDLSANNPLFEGTLEDIANRIMQYITVTPNPDNGWSNESVNISINLPDTHKVGLDTVPYSWDGGNSFTTSDYDTVTKNGQVTLVLKDRFGNRYQSKPIDVTNIDKVSPMIKAEEEEGSVKITASDEGSGIDRICQIKDGTEEILATYNGEANAVYSANITENGAYQYIVYDRAGNSSKQSLMVSKAKATGGNNGDDDKNKGNSDKDTEYVYLDNWLPSDVIYSYMPYEVPVYYDDYGYGDGGYGYDYGYDYGYNSGSYSIPASTSTITTPSTTKTSTSTKTAATTTTTKKEADTNENKENNNIKNAKLVVSSSGNEQKVKNPVAGADDKTVKETEKKTTESPDNNNALKTENENNKFNANPGTGAPEKKSGINWWLILAIACALGIVGVGAFIVYPMIRDKMLDKKFNSNDTSDDEDEDEDEDFDDEDEDEDEDE